MKANNRMGFMKGVNVHTKLLKGCSFGLTVLAILCPLSSAIAQGNLVFNGGFDTGVAGIPDGWTMTNGAVWGGLGNPTPAVALLNENPSPFTDPTASQTISGLVQGLMYMVAGDYQRTKDRGGGAPTDFSFGVAIDDVFLFEAIAPADFSWHSFNFFYTASSSSVVLSLSSEINGTGVEYKIDNISMHEVPEPSAAVLLALFGSAIVWLRRKQCLNR
jgi:hypothetical protein